jgi:glutamine synthetase
MTSTPPLTAKDVIALAAERNIRFVRLWFTDILGQLKAFSINAAELADAFEGWALTAPRSPASTPSRSPT